MNTHMNDLILFKAGYFYYSKRRGGRGCPASPLHQPEKGVKSFFRLYEHALKVLVIIWKIITKVIHRRTLWSLKIIGTSGRTFKEKSRSFKQGQIKDFFERKKTENRRQVGGVPTFLRTARSFYKPLWYLLTYLLTYLYTYLLTYKSSLREIILH